MRHSSSDWGSGERGGVDRFQIQLLIVSPDLGGCILVQLLVQRDYSTRTSDGTHERDKSSLN